MSENKLLSFIVPGVPQQRGSKNAFSVKLKNGTTRTVLADSNKKSVKHMRSINVCAKKAMDDLGLSLAATPVQVSVKFAFERPKAHFGTGKKSEILKEHAPKQHTKQPDVDKLVRCLLDGMTGSVYSDDRQVFVVVAMKQWSTESFTEVSIIIHKED